jgi:hypothetical protein
MVQGFADIHNHQFAYLGFGGLAFHGEAYGEIHKALSWCDYVQDSFPPIAIHGPAGTLDFIGNMIKGIYSGNFAPGHHVGGDPAFDGWPRWDSVTHQSVYETG